jgi:hypothetical protein
VANKLDPVIPRILAQALLLLRSMVIMPRIVNTSYGNDARKKGSMVEVPLAPKVAVRDVAPAATPPGASDITYGSAQIPLDFWKEAPFYMTDKDKTLVMDGTLPATASSAIKALAEAVNAYIFQKAYLKAYGFAGTAGTTPFATDTAAFKAARLLLNKANVAMEDRVVILDPDAEANALELAKFAEADKSGSTLGIVRGLIGEKFGALWLMDQQVPTHTAGVPGGTPLTNGAQLAGQGSKYDGDAAGLYEDGSGTLVIDGMTATTGTYKAGDVIEIAGGTETYAVVDDLTASGTGTGTLHIMPALIRDVADNAAITLKASHVANLLLQREAVAFATRPLMDTTEGLGIVQSLTDPKSGLTLRLEISRQHKQTEWAFDILCGAENIRPAAVARIAG